MSLDFDKMHHDLLLEMVQGKIDQATFEARKQALEELRRAQPRQELSPPASIDSSAPTQPRHLKPPELAPDVVVAGRYELVEFLGRGGMGQVWKAIDPQRADDQHSGFVVLKFLPRELMHDAEELASFKSAYRRIQDLHHEHICPVYDLGEDKIFGGFQVMRFIDGQTLAAYRKQHADAQDRLPPAEVARLLLPIAKALDYAHGKGLLHRDIKPSNIMIESGPGSSILIDFGLAAEVQTVLSQKSRGAIGSSGTPAYMAPEQWAGELQTGATDQYSLATVAYELLSGQHPFPNAPNAIALAHQVCHMQVRPPQDVNAIAWDALLRGLDKNRKQRFEHCEAFISRGLLAPQPQPTVPPPSAAKAVVATILTQVLFAASRNEQAASPAPPSPEPQPIPEPRPKPVEEQKESPERQTLKNTNAAHLQQETATARHYLEPQKSPRPAVVTAPVVSRLPMQSWTDSLAQAASALWHIGEIGIEIFAVMLGAGLLCYLPALPFALVGWETAALVLMLTLCAVLFVFAVLDQMMPLVLAFGLVAVVLANGHAVRTYLGVGMPEGNLTILLQDLGAWVALSVTGYLTRWSWGALPKPATSREISHGASKLLYESWTMFLILAAMLLGAGALIGLAFALGPGMLVLCIVPIPVIFLIYASGWVSENCPEPWGTVILVTLSITIVGLAIAAVAYPTYLYWTN